MKKFVKSKFDNQLESHKIFKKKLNLVKHKKNLYDPKNHAGAIILREQDAVNLNSKLILNDNIIKIKKKQKEDPNVQASISLRSKQNENSSNKLQLSNTIDSNYSKDFNCFSQSVDYSSLSHCNSKLLDSSFCTDSSHNIAGQSFKSRKKQLKEVVFGYSQEKKNISTATNNIESTNTACATKMSQDLIPSYRILRSSLTHTKQEFEQNNLPTDNTRLSTPANDISKAKTTESKIVKRKRPTMSRKEKIKRKNSNHVQSHEASRTMGDSELARCENSSGQKTDIIVPNFAYNKTLQGSVSEIRKNEGTNPQSGQKCLMVPLQNRMRTRSMGRMECIKMQEDINHQKSQEKAYETEHVIEVKEETIFQQNLQMTTHFHSKSDMLSCNLHGNKAQSSSKQQRGLRYSRRERNQGLTSKLQENADITETILQSNLQHLVGSKLNDGCDISMEVNKKNEYEVNKSVKIDNSKTNVHNSIKKKEIIKSECHIEIKTKGQDALNSLNKCEHNAIKTTKKTFVSKTINEGKSINSFKAITQKWKNKDKINKHYQTNKELIIPLIKLENLSLAKLNQLLHIPNYIENKINILEKKEAQYTIRNTSTEECTIIHKQYKVTKIKKIGEFDEVHNNAKKCKDQREHNLYENNQENTSPAQEINANLEGDNFVSEDQLVTERLSEQMAKESTDTLSSSSTKEYFTNKAKCQQVTENERTLNENQEPVLNKEHTHSNETILEQNDAEINSSNLETDEREIPKDNEVGEAEMLQNSKPQLQTNKLLQNIYKFYFKNKIKRLNSNIISKFVKLKKEKLKIPLQIAICSRCKQVLNLLQQFSGTTNFTKDEKLQIECTLCNVHMHSLSRFQQHLMDSHLQCEGNLGKIAKKPYTVDIINLNVGKVKKKFPIYECCCCLKVFNRLGNFKRHVLYVHHSFHNFPTESKKYKIKQITGSLETDVLNKNLIPETVGNTAEILNEVEDSTNVLNNANLNVNTEESQMETSETELNQKTDVTNSENVIESSNLNSGDNQSSQKQSKTLRKVSSYRCKICTKLYKRKRQFLLHMSKHATNSNNSKDCEKTSQETSVALNEEVGKEKCNSTTEETIPENLNISDYDNTNEERVLDGKNALDFHCMLHVNCTGTVRTGEKRQHFIRCNVNISKKLKTDSTVQQTLKNGTKDNLLTNYVDEPNVTFDGDVGTASSNEQEEIQCKICNIKFNSHKILKEHMILLHDSILEGREVLNLPDSDHSNNNTAEESVSAEGDENSRSDDNIPAGEAPEIFIEEEGRMYENIICEMLNDCSINKQNKKWRCNLCKENFALIRNYLRHRYYIHNDVSVVHVCDNCNKVLTSVAMVNIHRCTNVTSWGCRRCNLEFINGTYLAQHNINYHFETAGPHACDVCETCFLTQYMLEKHRCLNSSTNDCNNVNNFIDASIYSQNDLPYNLNGEGNNTESDTEDNSDGNTIDDFEYATENGKSPRYTNEVTTNLNGPAEAADIFSNKFGSSNMSLESDIEEMFKCKICDIVCLTQKEMKFHLENWHQTNAEVCELCNRLYIANELMEHLLKCHIITNDLDSTGNNTDAQLNYNRAEDFQQNVVDLLGLKRLITLYEYQRFNDLKSNCFNCVVCLMQFLSTQSYRLHCLKFHDTVCLLCNIEFKHQYQAFEHKIKIHVSVNSYLWVVEKLISSILQLNENGSTLENVILQYSERRIQDGETCTPEFVSLSNNKLEELNDKEYFHAAENVTSFI
ncbi:uncharacterized protein LOC143360241 [Halictus rubicundus]|uniref:uncharacterized protein LOC143360241 n=1 Tax=Halictus rubicundus TaxID=77578 RepID=UPI004036492F